MTALNIADAAGANPAAADESHQWYRVAAAAIVHDDLADLPGIGGFGSQDGGSAVTYPNCPIPLQNSLPAPTYIRYRPRKE